MKQQEIEALIQPVLNNMGYILWGCEYLSQGKHALLRIYIDHLDGIGIDDCEQASRAISATLDVENPISGQYTLEVSSPGIPKPLFYLWQYQQHIGEEVKLKVFKPVDKKRTISGVIASVNEDKITINMNEESIEILISNIVKAYLTV